MQRGRGAARGVRRVARAPPPLSRRAAAGRAPQVGTELALGAAARSLFRNRLRQGPPAGRPAGRPVTPSRFARGVGSRPFSFSGCQSTGARASGPRRPHPESAARPRRRPQGRRRVDSDGQASGHGRLGGARDRVDAPAQSQLRQRPAVTDPKSTLSRRQTARRRRNSAAQGRQPGARHWHRLGRPGPRPKA